MKSKIAIAAVALTFSTAALAAGGAAMKCCCKDMAGREMPAPAPAPAPQK
jgi:hypothetical protein